MHNKPRLPINCSFIPLPKTHTGPIYVTKFNNASEYIMTGSEDRGVCLYNPSKNLMIKHYKNIHNYDVSALDICKDNSKFVTGGGDKNLIITDVLEGKTIRKYTGHNGRINSLAYNPDNSIIVSGSYDTTVRCWDNRASSYSPIDIIKGFKDSVSHVQVLGYQIVCGSMDGSIRFYDVRMGQFTSDQLGQAVQSMCVANSNKAYIASALDNTIYLIQRSTGNKVMQYSSHKVGNYRIQCKFNPADTHIYTGSVDGRVYVYDIMKSQPVGSVGVGAGVLSAMDVDGDGRLALGGHDGSVYYCKM